MKSFKYFCTLLLTALTLAACSNKEIVEPEPNQQPAGEGIPFKAVFGVKNGSSRAITDPGDGTLNVSWAVGEQIAIVFGGNKYKVKVTEVDDDGNASVSGTLPSSTPHNQAVTYIYPASAADGSGLRSDLLAKQKGTLETLSKEFDVATAEGNIIIVDGTAQPNGTVTLENQFAICKFSFKDESGQPFTDIYKVTITDLSTTDVITVKTPTPQSAVYVAMKPVSHTMKFDVERNNGSVYTKNSNSSLQAGKFYVPPTFQTTYAGTGDLAIPLTIEAISDGTVTFQNKASGSVYYSIDGNELVEIAAGTTGTTPTLTAGQKVCFYGNNDTYATYWENGYYSFFTLNADCYVYGNVMSLIDSDDYPELKELTSSYTFYRLFYFCSRLKSHPDKTLVLPATTLAEDCYGGMFEECHSLTTAPELPATTLAQGCYERMFLGCRSLTTAPELPATTLAGYCYGSMFSECSSLTKAPDLPATTLEQYCYAGMFMHCVNLSAAPELPATRLEQYCYTSMFNACFNLSNVECLATSFGSNSTYMWLERVASSGTFTKAAGVNWATGTSGIPDGWTVTEE